jgi:hypothetical protein
VSALKTVLGDREYNGRRGHYNFYVRQLMDMYGQQGVTEGSDGEYDDEAGMAYGSLLTVKRAVDGLMDTIDSNDNLPEWCQEKISLAEDYLVTVWDYIQSEKEQGVNPQHDSGDAISMNEDRDDNPVADALIRRIMLQRTDLLGKYGPVKVLQAIDEVADFVGDVEEIGSSDVSGWVKHVEQMLGNMG